MHRDELRARGGTLHWRCSALGQLWWSGRYGIRARTRQGRTTCERWQREAWQRPAGEGRGKRGCKQAHTQAPSPHRAMTSEGFVKKQRVETRTVCSRRVSKMIIAAMSGLCKLALARFSVRTSYRQHACSSSAATRNFQRAYRHRSGCQHAQNLNIPYPAQTR